MKSFKTSKEWTMSFIPEIRDKIIENRKLNPGMSRCNKGPWETASHFLRHAFPWISSKEGKDFWEEIYENPEKYLKPELYEIF